MEICLTIPDTIVHDVVKGMMENMPECSLSMGCQKWKYDEMRFKFVDEDGTVFNLDKEKLLATFPLIFTDKFPAGLTPPPMSTDAKVWEDWLCQSDASTFDAFVQLCCFGEVIYG